MAATESGADDLANTLLTSLIAGKSFDLPTIDSGSDVFKQPVASGALYADIERINLDDLTTGVVGGTGVFDRLMVSLVNHLKVEYEANRISGAEYTKAYVGTVGAALTTAQQFLLTKEQSYWSALLVQQQVRTAEIAAATARLELETVRVTLTRAQYEAALAEANYALTKIKIATEDATYANVVAQTGQAIAQTDHIEAETDLTTAQSAGVVYTNENLLPAQKDLTIAEKANKSAQTAGITYTNENILPKQASLLGEQIEVQRAQTADTRTDDTTVVGVIGKQKDLYTQQITSYQRDAETKAVKIFTDSWITQKTIDEGLTPPDQFTNENINEVLVKLRGNLSLGS